ncbi:MAG: HEAT repeat domain-containing protein [Microcystaceae cyanobacterium]
MMTVTLDQAIAAIPHSNWSFLLQTLQRIPTQGKGQSNWQLNEQDWQKAQEICLELLKEGDFKTKWEIIKLYPKLGEKAIAPLGDLLHSETTDYQCRWFVVRLLREFNHLDSILLLVKLLYETEDEELLSNAYQSLSSIGKSAIDTLGLLMNEAEHRLLAVKALSQMRHPHTIPYLLRVVHDPAPETRTLAIEALGSFRDPAILEVLLIGLKDKAASVRKEVVIALALAADAYPQLSKVQIVETLKPLLYDVNLEVSQQTIFAIGRLENDEAAEALFTLLKSPATPNSLKLDTVRALSWIERISALTYLAEGLRWSDAGICQEIITVLGRNEIPELKEQASQIIVNFYYSSQQSLNITPIKKAIAVALGDLGQETGLDCLKELSQEEERSVKLHALAAIKKFQCIQT